MILEYVSANTMAKENDLDAHNGGFNHEYSTTVHDRRSDETYINIVVLPVTVHVRGCCSVFLHTWEGPICIQHCIN